MLMSPTFKAKRGRIGQDVDNTEHNANHSCIPHATKEYIFVFTKQKVGNKKGRVYLECQ